jgi:hypothetical protein
MDGGAAGVVCEKAANFIATPDTNATQSNENFRMQPPFDCDDPIAIPVGCREEAGTLHGR